MCPAVRLVNTLSLNITDSVLIVLHLIPEKRDTIETFLPEIPDVIVGFCNCRSL